MADDSLCRQCGRCCYKKIEIDGAVYTTPFPCEHLDVETRLCRVYEKRHVVNRRCLSVEKGIKRHAFPADCVYVRDLKDYEAPIEYWSWAGFEHLYDELADELDLSAEERERYRPLFFSQGKKDGERKL